MHVLEYKASLVYIGRPYLKTYQKHKQKHNNNKPKYTKLLKYSSGLGDGLVREKSPRSPEAAYKNLDGNIHLKSHIPMVTERGRQKFKVS